MSDVQRLAWAQYSADHLLARQLVFVSETSCVCPFMSLLLSP